MSVEISLDVIKKLTHSSEEIRLRALGHIELKFERAIAHQLTIAFNPNELCKQLIRWFKYPLTSKSNIEVLQLLFRVLESSYGKEAVDKLGVERLKNELKKVRKVLPENSEELQIIHRLEEILFNHDSLSIDQRTDSDIVSLVETLSITSNDDYTAELPNCISGDFETAWSKQSVADHNSLKVMADVLTSAGTTLEEKENYLQYLQIVIPDYPAEYMLQPPHLFAKLLQLCGISEEHEKPVQARVFATFLSYLKVLRECLCKQRKVDSFATKNTRSSNNIQGQIGAYVGRQLKVSKAMGLLLEKCLEKLETQATGAIKELILTLEVVQEIFIITKILHLNIEDKFFTKTNLIRKSLQGISKRNENHLILVRTKQIWLSFVLLEIAEINYKHSQLTDQHKILYSLLVDFSLQVNFPMLFKRIKMLVFAADKSIENKFNEIQKLKTQFEGAISLLMQSENDPSQIIAQAAKIYPVLNILKSFKLAKKVFDAILEAIPLILTESTLELQVKSLLLNLLQLQSTNVKLYIYEKIAIAVKKHFAALMNNEKICRSLKNKELLSALIIGVPFDNNILQQIIYDSFESNNPEIRKNAENILLLLLRTHHFFESAWCSFLKILSPILPLLICCTHSKPIYCMLLKLLDPDSKLFPFIDLLRGNIGFMFSNDSAVRSEALTRLIYVINSLPQASDYVPNIVEVSDILPNDLCMQETPRECRKIFVVNESYYELKTLQNLLKLLDTSDIEPQVRKSTLMQLNIMCKNWEIVAEFCKEQAYCLILSVLENSLRKYSSIDYIESVIPAISILVKLLIYDSGFQHELSDIPNVYVLLLRALFHFSQNVQLRQDTSICLFILIFGNFLAFYGVEDVETPKLISNLNIPFKSKFKTMTGLVEQPYACCVPDHLRMFFPNEAEWKNYTRQVIAQSYFKKLIISNIEIDEMRANSDICPSLIIEQHDAQFIKATNCFQNIRCIFKVISDATNQEMLIESITTLRLLLMLYHREYDTLSDLPLDLANGIYLLLSKYLQVTPGNSADFDVYESVLDILYLCVRLSSIPIIYQLKSVLCTNQHHGVMIMLTNFDIPLIMYYHLNNFLITLFRPVEGKISNAEQDFRNNLFKTVYEVIQQFYVGRNIQRIRCLLPLARNLTASCLGISEKTLHNCSTYFIKLSIHVRSSTRTGSQLHRDCLVNFIQIFNKLSEALKLRISENFLKHLVGLGGHHDMEVRALAWISLTLIANSREPNINGTQLIASKLCYLPGGFISCCIETFFDKSEAVLVRHFAGNLFVLLLNETTFQKAIQLIEAKTFFATAYTSLETCIFERGLPNTFSETPFEYEDGGNIELTTCEMVICYCRICIALIKLRSSFVVELCEKPLLFKLYELLKLPNMSSNVIHYEMCSQICHLYALCSKDNFVFLQKTLCHDDRWLSCLFDLLIPPSHATEESIVCVLQLILVLCNEEFVFYRLCSKLIKNLDVRHLFHRALTISHISSPLMRCSLSVFTYLLIKSQPEGKVEEDRIYFTTALEQEFKLTEKSSETAFHSSAAETNKENISWNVNLRSSSQRRKLETAKFWHKLELTGKASMSELILLDLYKIFIHLYPCNTCKFDCSPSATRIQICESISVLLKVSARARVAASNLKFLNNILLILENFCRELGINGVSFIKRHGDGKKLSIIKNLKILIQILLHWFSPSAGVLVDKLHCLEISKIIIQIWPWLEYSLELKTQVLQVCAFLSERSLPVCSQFSTLISPYLNSILQLVTKVVVTETHKVKTTSALHLPIVVMGLRVIINCCACAEGRFVVIKEHILDVIDGLYPFNMKSPKIRIELLQNWLQFWELFSRYSEGGQVRNLNILCTVINRSVYNSQIRIVCLKILRNMCFVYQNRSALMTSSDFIYTANEVISQPLGNDLTDPAFLEEQLVVSVAIWQLISGGVKYMAILRGTKLAKNLQSLREKLLTLNEEDPDLFTKLLYVSDLTNVLEFIINICTES